MMNWFCALLLTQLLHQGGIVPFDELGEQRLFGSVALVSNVTKGFLALQQHADRASLRWCQTCPCCIGEVLPTDEWQGRNCPV
ncbi:MAG: hypothetical protein O7F73_20860, partial [Gammaproteobacteria bacterium]|nr:hypothetical protein [Gammaproteobacteria bacterium]